MNVSRALLIIDVQNDFCGGGKLAVPGADTIIPEINKYITLFSRKNLPVFASRDWHPVRAVHFKKYGGTWPEHCVQNTPGARFHPGLRLPHTTVILSKGMNPGEEGYSAFEGVDSRSTPFEELLLRRRVTEIVVTGLATDYCVKATAMDAIGKGFAVIICTDAVKGIDRNPGDSEKAITELVMLGAIRTDFESIATEFEVSEKSHRR